MKINIDLTVKLLLRKIVRQSAERQQLNQPRKLALLNDPRIYELANTVLEDFLKDHDKANALIKRLRLQRSVSKSNIRQGKRKG